MGIGLVHVESIKIMRERKEQKTRPLLYDFLRQGWKRSCFPKKKFSVRNPVRIIPGENPGRKKFLG
jgi:hypothetical protein